ncbi:hypothetical protein F8O01_00460 [Pseudoclavibacter chungangensis]|uniref:Uncharacterized protein n=1 Tax=Pseudoclavibacter chungangensis TaxID=587635 RepID=A0A7J5C1E7_9MICO|nr:hypothetical protein [Pseudoclavibacter chungangensis]KAB1662457.1 hypothetical protein F8O01_00460 [Pseudoclavibacter chungangensis]NYJ68489.1 hypothetical protein [Pseudoclavibacter chungangensis]
MDDERGIDRRIDEVAWDQLFHAFGTAGDTAHHLRALAAGRECAQAAAHVGTAIVHQSTVWPASADALRLGCEVLSVTVLPVPAVDGVLAALAEAGRVLSLEVGGDPQLPRRAREAFFEARRLAAEGVADDEVRYGPGDDEPVTDEAGEIVVEILFTEFPDEAAEWMRSAVVRMRELAPLVLETLDALGRRGAASPELLDACRRAWAEPAAVRR